MMLRVLVSSCLVMVLGSFAAGQEGRETIVLEDVIAAPIEDVWRAFTTQEGIEGFMASHAEVDFRMGGTIQTHYGQDASIGDPGTIRHTILAMEPGRMYSARVDFPFDETLNEFQEFVQETWGVVTLESISPGVTRIRMASCNYGTGGAWEGIRAFFDQGNAIVIGKLKAYLEVPDIPTQGNEVMRLLGMTAGGEWKSSQTMPDGKTLTSRNITTLGPDGRTLLSKGWLGDGESEFWHASVTIWQDPGTGLVWFHDINQSGDIAQGIITTDGTNKLVWDWQVMAADGSRTVYIIRQHYVEEDTFVQRIYSRGDDGTEKLFVETTNRRVVAEQGDESTM